MAIGSDYCQKEFLTTEHLGFLSLISYEVGTLEAVKIQTNNSSCYMWKSKHLIFNDTLGGKFMIYSKDLSSQAHSLLSPWQVGNCNYSSSRVSGLDPVFRTSTKSLIVLLLLYFDIHVKISDIRVCLTALHWQKNSCEQRLHIPKFSGYSFNPSSFLYGIW